MISEILLETHSDYYSSLQEAQGNIYQLFNLLACCDFFVSPFN